MARFDPGPGAAAWGCCSTTSSPGSKEQRAAERLPPTRTCWSPATPSSTCGRPIDPSLAGLAAWPDVPRGGRGRRACRRPAASSEPAGSGASLLRRVRTYADLDPALVGAVEQLIDFVTVPAGCARRHRCLSPARPIGARPRRPVADPDPPPDGPAPWRRLGSREVYRNPWLRP